jgi:hypothetical protein
MLSPEPASQSNGLFPHTQWSIVLAARAGDTPAALEALDALARAYWQPLFIFVRLRGLAHDDATEAVQGFFAHLLSREFFTRIERRETRFRTFLLASFKNWLNDQHDRVHAVKRGGGAVLVSLSDFESVENLPLHLADGAEAPEREFDRRWARALYEQAMNRLAGDHAGAERTEYFAALRKAVFGGGRGAFEEIAARFAMNATAVRRAASDLRARFGRLLRSEVARVVSDPAEVDEELRYLLQLLTD